MFEVILQSQNQKQGFLRVGDISNNPKNHESLGLGNFNPSKLDLTSVSIRENPISKILNKNDPTNANVFFQELFRLKPLQSRERARPMQTETKKWNICKYNKSKQSKAKQRHKDAANTLTTS